MQAEAHTSDELLSPLLQRLERLEASVLIQTQNYTGSSSGGEAETKALADHAYHGSPARGPGPSSTITSLAPRDTAVDRRVVALENKIEQVPMRLTVPAFVRFDGGSLEKHRVSHLWPLHRLSYRCTCSWTRWRWKPKTSSATTPPSPPPWPNRLVPVVPPPA